MKARLHPNPFSFRKRKSVSSQKEKLIELSKRLSLNISVAKDSHGANAFKEERKGRLKEAA